MRCLTGDIRKRCRDSIVGTRKDLAEAIEFAAAGHVHTSITLRPLEDINKIFAELKAGHVDGCIVLDMR